MNSENLFDNYFNNNIEKNLNSDFYGNNEDINNNNNETTTNTENDTNKNESINAIPLDSKKIRENFIKKKNSENIIYPLVRITNEETELFRIEALKYSKAFDYYYSETLDNEFWKKENQKYFIKKSKNFVSKSKFIKNKEEELNGFITLYYAIKINDNVTYTYYDQYYNQYKSSKFLLNMQNINNNFA